MCFAGFAMSVQYATAEETDDADARGALIEKIRALQAAKKAERQEVVAEKKAEHKAERTDFMSSLDEDMTNEERRAAIIEFITQWRAEKAAVKENVTDAREERKEAREAFKTDFADMTPEEKREALLARIAELTAGNDDEDESEESDDAADESDAEEDDESEEGEGDDEEEEENDEVEDDESDEEVVSQ